MHELAIVTAFMEVVDEEVRSRGGGRVAAITLCVGGLQAVEPATLTSCFQLLAEGTVMDGAALTVERLPVRIHCHSCNAERQADSRFHCASCGGADVAIVSTGGLFVKSIVLHAAPSWS